ncbi:MAG: hypothetical protein M1820_003483 [Bogoriella megaspora]|nr:MAG: hypothetical protein M1820_003483 [Bogoriella megaspora]
MSIIVKEEKHWLDRYASGFHGWTCHTQADHGCHSSRNIGLVESGFDDDGRNFEGRADVHGLLKLHIEGSYSEENLRERIELVWANLLLRYPMLRATVIESHRSNGTPQRHFTIKKPGINRGEYLAQSTSTIVQLKDHTYYHVDPADFLKHAENTSRILNPAQTQSKLFVLPPDPRSESSFQVSLMFIIAHEITDGLTMYNWLPHFHSLLNQPISSLRKTLDSSLTHGFHLPPAQEDLYPPIIGSLARQRWHWLLFRILRHIRRPLPRAFPNPLSRQHPFPPGSAPRLPPSYPTILDYSTVPPLLTYRAYAVLPPQASATFLSLTKDLNVSPGATAFALLGLVMQTLHASLHPTAPRDPFIASFPLNPRSYFQPPVTEAASLMLAFSDGIVLPFLPPDLPVIGRLRVLAKRAQRELRRWQKRELGEKGKRDVLGNLYCWTQERRGWDVQGEYNVRPRESGATCGVSWLGKVEDFIRGPRWEGGDTKVNNENGGDDREAEFKALWVDVDNGVRVREREFLAVGVIMGESVRFAVSYDGNAYDEELIRKWEKTMETILLEDSERARL